MEGVVGNDDLETALRNVLLISVRCGATRANISNPFSPDK